MFWPLMLAAGATALLFAGTFYYLVRSKGLDPSLITYANPLSRGGYWVLRLVLLLGAAAIELSPYFAYLFLGIAAASCILNVLLLALFGRLPTQPGFYLFVLGAISIFIIYNPTGVALILAFIFVLIAEAYLALWQKKRDEYYNRWVYRRTLSIHHRFQEIFQNIEDGLRFDVLHVAVTEDIARPTVVRLAERIYFYIKQPSVISSGLMQVRSGRLLSDEESIKLGAEHIKHYLRDSPRRTKDLKERINSLARLYNGSLGYSIYLESTYPGVARAWEEISR